MEIRAKERLSEKLDRYIEFTRVAEVEKDDMREAVSLLVEKGRSRSSIFMDNRWDTCACLLARGYSSVVELSNDYSLWPHSRIRCTDATGSWFPQISVDMVSRVVQTRSNCLHMMQANGLQMMSYKLTQLP